MQTPRVTENYFASLDGLRTIAVGLVIAFHLSVPFMGLGFAGVDVFFVLSGYLITSGLLRDTEKYGRPQYAKFWQRRFKRLLPAAMLVLITVLVYATFFTPLFRKAAVSWDVFWTTIYLANWHFMGANSYFSSDGTPSLLLHMWSLAVEEQFYFAWPLIIGLVAFVAAKVGARKHTVKAIGIAAAVLIVVSALLLMLLFVPDAPDRAYMGTDTKAFEPLLGALLAILLTKESVSAWFAAHHRIIALVGAVMAIAVLPFLAGPSSFYFHGGAIILSVGVALVIGALVSQPAPTAMSRTLAWRPMAYLGQISYGLYLWHWPWSVWLDVAHQEEFRMLRAPAALAGTLICAVLSYHLVEEPIRRGRLSKWFTPLRTLIVSAIVMALLIGWATALRQPMTRPQTPVSATPGSTATAPAVDQSAIVVVGDSVPYRLMESFDEVATDNGLLIDNASRGGCPPLSIEMQEYNQPDHEGEGDCTMIADLQTEKLEQLDPGIVFWWSRYEIHQRWIGDEIVGPEQEEFWTALRSDLEASVDRLTAEGATLIIAQTERPGEGMLTRCTEDDCHPLLDLMTNHDEHRRRWNQMVVDLAASDDRVRTFRMDPLLCKDEEPSAVTSPALCDDGRVNGQLRPDGSHVLVDPYGTETAETILDAVLRAALD